MMHEKAMSIHAALGEMLPRVSAEDAEKLRICRRNLAALADLAQQLETSLPSPLSVEAYSRDATDCVQMWRSL